MCRLLIYTGAERHLAEWIVRSEHSLIRQSIHACEMPQAVNGDGFGIGWYTRGEDPTPCIFTGLTPAWSNRNLRRLAVRIRSHCCFAHVRAATDGGWVDEVNCHPFRYGRFLWMHNGRIARFERIKRNLRRSLRNDLYDAVRGGTDSEHAFYVFLSRLEQYREQIALRLRERYADLVRYKTQYLDLLHDRAEEPESPRRLVDLMVEHLGEFSPEMLRRAMIETIDRLCALTREAGVEEPSFYNFAVTDGSSVIVTRYSDRPAVPPPTLYCTRRMTLAERDGSEAPAMLVTSERMLDVWPEWVEIPPQHLLVADGEGRVWIDAIESGPPPASVRARSVPATGPA
jgi:predicted glutamine amidotransferase